jgi:AGCS family alanine or glycine:cation symporter
MLEMIETANSWLNGIVWGPPFMILLAGTGLYLTIRLGFFQFTHLRYAWRNSFGQFFSRKKSEEEEGSITSFQAVSSAMAATIGTGNIAGVATAIALGGPGAIFWMWVIALVGMATKMAEATLGLKYREVNEHGHVSGGVFYYIEKGLGKNWKWLGMVYALFAGIAAFGLGNMVQSNTLAHALETGFNVPTWVTGVVAMVLVGAVTLGGITRIAATAEKVVPAMALIYVAGSLVILALNASAVPEAFGMIFKYAFSPAPAMGGFAGAGVAMAIQMGVARGIFSNEAGLGASSIVHAQAQNKPFAQGFWGIWEVFIDTLIVCTMTALVILTTGAIETGNNGAELTATAFSTGLPGPGQYLVLIAIVFFAYTTMITWNFYGEKSWEYLFGERIVLPYRLMFLGFVVVGAVGGLELIWSIADTFNGLMAAPNLIALILLAGVMAREKDAYFQSHKP